MAEETKTKVEKKGKEHKIEADKADAVKETKHEEKKTKEAKKAETKKQTKTNEEDEKIRELKINILKQPLKRKNRRKEIARMLTIKHMGLKKDLENLSAKNPEKTKQ